MPITIALLDRLDARFDRIRDNGAARSGQMQRDYWTMRQWIDARRNELQPMCIYPEPAPVINCPHPPDRDYCGEYFDPVKGEMRLWRGCTICGEVWDMPYPRFESTKAKAKKSRKKKEKQTV